MAETITLGKVSVSPKGAYSSTASYTFLDAVSHNGGAFLCLQNSTGVEPGVSSGWQSYWMETSKGIKQISISSAQEGQATITVTLSDGTVSTATFDTGVVVAQTGEGPPTTSTVAAYIGQLYVDTTAAENPAYICVGITTADNVTTYVWQPVGGTIEDGSITAEKLAPNAIPDALGYNPGMVNPNLIDNWYFVGGGSQQGGGQFPINQRGQTSYTGTGYTIDRWTRSINTGNVLVQSDGVLLDNSNGTETMYFTQFLEFAERGNLCVASLFTEQDFVVLKNTPAAGGQESTDWGAFRFGVSSSNLTFVQIQVSQGKSAIIKAVKLELGSKQTLARQVDGQWVLNEIPNFGEQLARCYRYLQKLFIKKVGYTNDTLLLPVEMRQAPSTTIISVGGTIGKVSKYQDNRWDDIDGGSFAASSPKELEYYFPATSIYDTFACTITLTADL